LDNYYIKWLVWYDDLYRIRKWNIRIIFQKKIDCNYIVAVDTRWQIYKGKNKV
jgi:mRNA-degrading endonuclease RelE of RelBE toxin-antitoxin system